MQVLPLLLPLWPAGLVWGLIVLPQLAWHGKTLRESYWLQPLPWTLRALLWSVEHVWPYTKVVRVHDRWARWEAVGRDLSLLTDVCSITSWHDALKRMPGPHDLGLPPRSLDEAMSWLVRPDGQGEAMREQLLAVNRVVTRLPSTPAGPTEGSGRWTSTSGAATAAGPSPADPS